MKVVIIGCMDKFANAVRPSKIKNYLEQNGHQVEIINTYEESTKKPSLLKKMIPKIVKNLFFYRNFLKRANHLKKEINNKSPDLVICESEKDSYVLTKDLSCIKMYDAASPWVDEYKFSGKLSLFFFKLLRKRELEIYKSSDIVSFHWYNYTRYVKKNIYDGKNLFRIDWGCTPKNKFAKYSSKPKIIFLGYLEGYWNNIPLLKELSKLYEIDVYGGPEHVAKTLGLNYKGYAKNLDILANYQFGLITITEDDLRKSSFSSKHLEYLSYGLPVLTPNWRKDPDLKDVSIYFDKNNFVKQIEKFSSKKNWESMSKACLKKSRDLDWNNQLKALDTALNKVTIKK